MRCTASRVLLGETFQEARDPFVGSNSNPVFQTLCNLRTSTLGTS